MVGLVARRVAVAGGARRLALDDDERAGVGHDEEAAREFAAVVVVARGRSVGDAADDRVRAAEQHLHREAVARDGGRVEHRHRGAVAGARDDRGVTGARERGAAEQRPPFLRDGRHLAFHHAGRHGAGKRPLQRAEAGAAPVAGRRLAGGVVADVAGDRHAAVQFEHAAEHRAEGVRVGMDLRDVGLLRAGTRRHHLGAAAERGNLELRDARVIHHARDVDVFAVFAHAERAAAVADVAASAIGPVVGPRAHGPHTRQIGGRQRARIRLRVGDRSEADDESDDEGESTG